MTVKAEGNVFIRYGHGLKVEADAAMARDFAEICRALDVPQAYVLRLMISDFVAEARGELGVAN